MQLGFSEQDLALVHALQLSPRASWSALAPVLGASPTALAQRWARLRGAGLAWVAGYPMRELMSGETLVALAEVNCTQGTLTSVATRLEQIPEVITIEHTAHGRDLLVTVNARTFGGLSALLLDQLSRIPGVASTRSHLGARMHFEGGRWRLDALDQAQRDAIGAQLRAQRRDAPAKGQLPSDLTTPVLAPLVRELCRDGRASAAELATRVGRPASTVRRQLATLLRSDALALRCEVAQLYTRWPVCVTWWCRLPGSAVCPTVARLRKDPRVRMCVSLTGAANFLVQAWITDMAELVAAQNRLERLLPAGEITDSSVTLRTRKRMGWLLHPDGRCTGEVVPTWLRPRE